MKNLIWLSVLYILLAAGCSKEELTDSNNNNSNSNSNSNNNNTNLVNSFEENESLVDPNATVYFIADVEGIPGVEKINHQNTTEQYCVAGMGSADCPDNYKQYKSQVEDSGFPYWVTVNFRGLCSTPACPATEIVKLGVKPIREIDQPAGLSFVYDVGDEDYWSVSTDNTACPDSYAEVISVERVGSANFVKVHFTATLKGDNGTIKLKNAVFRSKF